VVVNYRLTHVVVVTYRLTYVVVVKYRLTHVVVVTYRLTHVVVVKYRLTHVVVVTYRLTHVVVVTYRLTHVVVVTYRLTHVVVVTYRLTHVMVVTFRLTHVVVVLLLSILLQSPQILLRQRLLFDRQAVQTPGGLGAQLIEEVQEGGGVHLAGGHADVGVHDLEVGHSAVLVQPGVVTQQFVQEGVARPHLQQEAFFEVNTYFKV
jgi:hypothetical protein